MKLIELIQKPLLGLCNDLYAFMVNTVFTEIKSPLC
uniref:Uncharacterized protein n=1 Tax=Anguilla anguilla TaxID=7936 RepID=A0A0E9VWB1_ANGAN